MKSRLLLLFPFGLFLVSATALAGPNPNFTLPLHVVESFWMPCENYLPIDCLGTPPATAAIPNHPAVIYLLVFNHAGITALQAGLEWDPSWTWSFALFDCQPGQLEGIFPDGPTTASGVTVFNCLQGPALAAIGRITFQVGHSGCLKFRQPAFPLASLLSVAPARKSTRSLMPIHPGSVESVWEVVVTTPATQPFRSSRAPGELSSNRMIEDDMQVPIHNSQSSRPGVMSFAPAILTLLVVGAEVLARPGSGTGDHGTFDNPDDWSDKSWFDPTLPGIPSHAAAYVRRNPPRFDPLEDPGVISVSDIPLLHSLLGRWQEVDLPAHAAYRDVDSVDSGILECTATHGGAIVEMRCLRSWSTNVLPGRDVRNELFATDERFYIHRANDRGRVLQLAGGRSESSIRVSHNWDYSGVGEEWSFVSADTLKLSVWQSRSSGWCGTVLVEDHLFTKIAE